MALMWCPATVRRLSISSFGGRWMTLPLRCASCEGQHTASKPCGAGKLLHNSRWDKQRPLSGSAKPFGGCASPAEGVHLARSMACQGCRDKCLLQLHLLLVDVAYRHHHSLVSGCSFTTESGSAFYCRLFDCSTASFLLLHGYMV